MKGLTVLYILDPGTIGGATNAFLTLINELQKKEVTPIVCVSEEGIFSKSLNHQGIKTIAIGHYEMITAQIPGHTWDSIKRRIKRFIKYVLFDIRALQRIYKNTDVSKIDVIHTNSSRTDVGFFLNMLSHKPHVVHIREFGDTDLGVRPLNPFYISIYNRYSSIFLSVSKAVKQHWVGKGIKRDKINVVYDGIDYIKITPSRRQDKNGVDLHVVMSGGVCRFKGQYLAIEAIGLLPYEVKKHIYLDLIGWCWKPYDEELLKLSQDVGMVNNVNILGARNDVLNLLKNYQIGLMCSKSEGFGLVTAEFMFAELGVIAANSGASPELVHDNETGLIFNSGDAQSLSDAILYYYNHRDVMTRHADAARKDAMQRFRADINAENVYQQYLAVLNK